MVTNVRDVTRLRRWGEGKQHEAAKIRIGKVLQAKGWRVEIDSQPFTCNTSKGERTYWPDVYAQNFCLTSLGDRRARRTLSTGGRRIIVEIQGPKGHNTKAARGLDNLRLASIRQWHGEDIEYYEVFLKNKKSKNDIRNWSEQDILEHVSIS